MAINLTINGSVYSFPEPNDNDWGQDVTDWASAITSGTVQKEGGNVEFLNDLDIGTSSGVISNYFKSRSADIADDGVLRLSNTDTIQWRNSTNDGNVVISVDGGTLKIDGEVVGYRFLNELEDVALHNTSDGEYLVYNSNGWFNKRIEINDISEIVITTPNTKDVLYYDGVNFVNKSIELNDIDNVVVNTPTTTEFLGYDGTDFINKEVKFNDVTEVNVTTPVTNQALMYDGTDWVNKTIQPNDIDTVDLNNLASGEYVYFDGSNLTNKNININDVSEISVNNPLSTEFMRYDGNEWTNQGININDIPEINVVSPVASEYLAFDGVEFTNTAFDVNADPNLGNKVRTIIGDVTQDINGFPTRVDSVLSFNDVDKSVTITPINTEFDVLYRGKTITINTPQTLNFTQVSGGRYINIDNVTGQLIEGNENPSIINDLLCAYVYYNATSDKIVIKGDERHSSSRDTTWHRSKHIEQGMVHRSGGALSYSLADPNTITVGVATPLVVADEDLDHAIIHSNTPTNPFEQILDGVAQIPIIYIDSTGYYTQDDPTTTPYKMGTNNIAYNSVVGGVGSQVDVDNGKFMNYYIIVTNCTKYPVKVIQGRGQYDTEAQAQEEALHALNLPFPELTAIHQLIVQVDTNITENPFKISLVSVLQPVKDMFSGTIIGSVSGASAADHEELTGRSKPDSHPASAIRDSTYNQSLQDTLDDIVSEAEAEAGVSTIRRSWTAERVKQAALSVIAPQIKSLIKRTVYTSSTTWTKDPETKWLYVQVWAAGGSGALILHNGQNFAQGGGGGQYIEKFLHESQLNAGKTATITVGVGGQGHSVTAAVAILSGNTGGSSFFNSNNSLGSYIYAWGGMGGVTGSSNASIHQANGAQYIISNIASDQPVIGLATLCPLGMGGSTANFAGTYRGGFGGNMFAGGGGGGSYQVSTNNGGYSTVAGHGGHGVSTQTAYASITAGNGVFPGGGGGGAYKHSTAQPGTVISGSGANGQVIVWEFK